LSAAAVLLGAERWAVWPVLLCLAILALPAVEATPWILGPMHVETVALVLAGFLAVASSQRPGWRAILGGVAFIGLACLGDPSAYLFGALPLLVLALERAWRRRQIRTWAALLAVAGGGALFSLLSAELVS